MREQPCSHISLVKLGASFETGAGVCSTEGCQQLTLKGQCSGFWGHLVVKLQIATSEYPSLTNMQESPVAVNFHINMTGNCFICLFRATKGAWQCNMRHFRTKQF